MKLTPPLPPRIHLPQRLPLTLAAVVLMLLLSAMESLEAQGTFRTSLTATISRLPADTVASGADSLRCRRISLHWRELAGARRYVVYTSSSGGEPWVALPNRNACGPSVPEGSTGLSDVQPASGASTGARKVHYKVVALAGDGPDARALDTTSAVTVELR